jgi:serine/threonine protein kinase
VAVKLLPEQYPADSPAAGRFLGEARITGQLQHPGIPAVHQVGTLAGDRPLLAMKLIKGCTLEAILKQRTDPSAQRGRLLAVFEAVCQAVGYAHAHRVIHRDLKPANVMVGAFGEVQVMDWGLAKVLGEETPATAAALAMEQTRTWTQVSPTPEFGSHTQAGSLLGTPAFAPPEQLGGEIDKVGTRADVFGLGAIRAVILTGKPPYVGETAESVRVLALRGKLDDCFARLDACGTDAHPTITWHTGYLGDSHACRGWAHVRGQPPCRGRLRPAAGHRAVGEGEGPRPGHAFRADSSVGPARRAGR